MGRFASLQLRLNQRQDKVKERLQGALKLTFHLSSNTHHIQMLQFKQPLSPAEKGQV